VIVAVGAAAASGVVGPRVFGFTPLDFLLQPAAAPSATMASAIAKVLRTGGGIGLMFFLLQIVIHSVI
jgi:hypothetical protein